MWDHTQVEVSLPARMPAPLRSPQPLVSSDSGRYPDGLSSTLRPGSGSELGHLTFVWRERSSRGAAPGTGKGSRPRSGRDRAFCGRGKRYTQRVGFEGTGSPGARGRQGAAGVFWADSGRRRRTAARRESTFHASRDSETQPSI